MEFTRASHFTGCHWSPFPLLHDNITELMDVRDLALLHLPFEDAPQMLNRVYVWRHAWPVHHLYPQLLSQGSGRYHVGILPCGPVSEGRGSCSASVCNSTCWHSWFPLQPQTMTLPPPCLTVGKTHLSLYSSPGCHHTRLTPSEPHCNPCP